MACQMLAPSKVGTVRAAEEVEVISQISLPVVPFAVRTVRDISFIIRNLQKKLD